MVKTELRKYLQKVVVVLELTTDSRLNHQKHKIFYGHTLFVPSSLFISTGELWTLSEGVG